MQRIHPGYQGLRVVLDILPNLIESSIRANDVLPIIALPGRLSESFGYRGLEGADYYGNGSGMPDPYVPQDQDSMDVIRHHYKRVQRDVGEMMRDCIPTGGNDILAKYVPSLTGANRYEVGAR